MRIVDMGHGLIGPTPAPSVQPPTDTLRERAAELEGTGRNWTGSHNQGTGKRTVNVKMPSGQILRGIGGELLVSALANGGQPVE
jgi:hypothetical protein